LKKGTPFMAPRPIYYDTETTGLKHEKDRIIEIAFYDPVKDQSFVSFVNPEMPVPEESVKICGITTDMVKDAPTFKELIDEMEAFCSRDCILIAHNNDTFDVHFLKSEYARAKRAMPEYLFIDSLKWARKYRPDLPKHNLQYLREVYKIEENQAHRALDDVIVLHQIFSQMIDDLPINKVHSLIYQTTKTSLRVMPFGKHKGTPLHKLPNHYVDWLKQSGALDKPENEELKKAIDAAVKSEPALSAQ
jgi:DNA polymerase-3 subunit epsilon